MQRPFNIPATAAALIAAAFFAPANLCRGDQPAAAEIDALIEQLGADTFVERETATERLVEMGLAARPALQQAAKGSDRETRQRAEQIVVLIEELDFERRLAAFAAGEDENEDYDLPGWSRYREVAGADASARELFVEMQKSESETLRAIDRGAKAATEMLELRARQLQPQIQFATVGSATALLLLAADEQVGVSPQASSIIYSLCHQPAFKGAIYSGRLKGVTRRLLGCWIARGEDATAYQGLNLAMTYDIPEGLVPAEKLLQAGGQQPHVLQFGILTIAKLGDERHLEVLETLLHDKTLVSRPRINNMVYEAQLRDVALAALVHLTKQDHKDFGFDRLQSHPTLVFNTSTLGFADEKQREAAQQKWREYREEEKKQDRG